jgi:hypothetical protein
MNSVEWQLIEEQYQNEFGSPMKGSRWRNKFGALQLEQLQRAIFVYAEESNSKPTVRDLMRCLPRGLVRAAKPDHMHAWQEFPPFPDEAGMAVICDTCGSHNRLRCQCRICLCDHAHRKRVTRNWYECPDCNSAVRAKQDDPDVPF